MILCESTCISFWWTKILSLGNIILAHGKIPKVTIFLIEIPYTHSVVIIYQLVARSPLHIVDLGFKVVGLIGFVHLNYAKYHCKQCCSNVQVLPLKQVNKLNVFLIFIVVGLNSTNIQQKNNMIYSRKRRKQQPLPEHWAASQQQLLEGKAMR